MMYLLIYAACGIPFVIIGLAMAVHEGDIHRRSTIVYVTVYTLVAWLVWPVIMLWLVGLALEKADDFSPEVGQLMCWRKNKDPNA